MDYFYGRQGKMWGKGQMHIVPENSKQFRRLEMNKSKLRNCILLSEKHAECTSTIL